ncbi:MAG: PilZ domain-containing protein [Bdellovibrionaceae bacterium]|nr:PilZ domain-containing protein [Pseudobdellovibrionaceae bacterium]
MMKENVDAENLRKFPRKSYKRLISILYRGHYVTMQSVEISEGGLSFVSEVVLDNDAECVVNMQIPRGDFVSVRATIRHSSKIDGQLNIGLSFNQMPFSNKRQIRSYVAAR